MQVIKSKSIIYFFLIFTLAALVSACNSKKNKIIGQIDLAMDSVIIIPFEPLLTDSLAIANFTVQFPLFKYHSQDINAFYNNRNYNFGWFDSTGITQTATKFINLLNHLGAEGIHDTVIYITDLNNAVNNFITTGNVYTGKNKLTEQIELLLTSEFLVYAQKVWGGISESESRELNWYVKRKTLSSTSLLDSILNGSSTAFASFQPQYKQYELLKSQLKFYKAVADSVTWDSLFLPIDKKFLEEGDSYPEITLIKDRLHILGDFPSVDTSTLFDSITTNAVKKFQSRFGLTTDGRAGKQFFETMNTPLSYRIAQIEINMERCRWIPTDLKGDFVIVNIPEFKAHVYSADTLSWDMQVIVGRTSTSTTIFNDEIKYIVFSPYWYVPGSIIRNEIFPTLVKNSDYLNRNHMELYDYSTRKTVNFNSIDISKYSAKTFPFGVRQKPGAFNSLGWAKFIFPNAYNIYLHDTPARNLFAETQRNFSHGCIRISEPQKFAEFLLRNDSTWTKASIDSVMHGGKETKAILEKPVPVMIVYFTSWVNENGILNFRKDIYNHDSKMLEKHTPIVSIK
ncbi:MAG TPA: L,D-transpeptidase family protein [Chitinophagales bacterium]|nr:L,D-transpeptidase family protein [Chitinophagales bacterium]